MIEALVELSRLVWPDEASWQEFRIHIGLVRARLLISGVRRKYVEEVVEAARCARNDAFQDYVEVSDGEWGEAWAISSDLIRDLEEAQEQVIHEMAPWHIRRTARKD